MFLNLKKTTTDLLNNLYQMGVYFLFDVSINFLTVLEHLW